MVTGAISGIVAFVLTSGGSVHFNSQSDACFEERGSLQGVVLYLLIGTNILMQGSQILCSANASYWFNFTLSQ